MTENEIWPSRHKVKFVVFRRGDENKRYFASGGVTHLRKGKPLITSNFMRFGKRGDQVYKENVCSLACIERIRPIDKGGQFIRRMKAFSGGSFDFRIFCD